MGAVIPWRQMAFGVAAALAPALSHSVHAQARSDATVTMPVEGSALTSAVELGYAESIVSGDAIYLSGVVASLRQGETTPDAAFQRAFERIAGALDRVGCTWDDVVDLTTFHTDVVAQLPFFVAAKNRHVRAPFPAWTAIGVTRLIPAGGIAEIKVVARVSTAERGRNHVGGACGYRTAVGKP